MTPVKHSSLRSNKALPPSPLSASDTPEHGAENPFPIVGIGASSGGLEAFTQVIQALPPDSGMAFVFVQHLDPHHESILAEILAKATKMPVHQAEEGMQVMPDNVYVIPPDRDMAIVDGTLALIPRPTAPGAHMPIDLFFRSLAEIQVDKAVGVVLSGNGADGSLGLEAIHHNGGMALAQDPRTAKFDSMPRSAVATGCVDAVLPPEGIAHELARLARHPYVRGKPAEKPEDGTASGENALDEIFAAMRKLTGTDFTRYKRSMIQRRVLRRMMLQRIEKISDYLACLKDNPSEAGLLHNDLLIQVTRFFRDPEMFDALKERVFPDLLKRKTADDPIRLWVVGCSSGEEVYSLAMCLLEFLGEKAGSTPIQFFGTDISERGLEKARAGLFPAGIEADVSPERLRRFFTKMDGLYQINKPVRDMCVFAKQNILKDPPFSRMDLITCRNLLIYIEPDLQKKVLPVFHFALKASGWLVLGPSESPGTLADLFSLQDKKHKIFSKKHAPPRLDLPFSVPSMEMAAGRVPPLKGAGEKMAGARKEADRALLDRYAPVGVVVDEKLEILEFRGDTSPYLQNVPGEATFKLLKMARENLAGELSLAFRKAKKGPYRKARVRVGRGGQAREVALVVIPLGTRPPPDRHWAVMFEESALPAPRARKLRKCAKEPRDDRWKQELSSTKAYLQSVIEEKEGAFEEMQSANEEAISSNEELQSINEELQTAKEELQATNEELATVNDQLRHSNQETAAQMNDLNNLIDSSQVPIIMVGNDLRIRRFTPQMERILNLIPTDIGRPIGDITPRINVRDLNKMIVETIDTVSIQQETVRDQEGRWYTMQVRPYKTLDKKIEGAVILLSDIDAAKRREAAALEAQAYTENILETVREPLVILDMNLRVKKANRSFYEAFRASPQETEGRVIYELENRQWDIPRLRTLMEGALLRDEPFNDFEMGFDSGPHGRRSILLNARRIRSQDQAQDRLILLAIEDVTDKERAAGEARKLNVELEGRVKRRTTELAASNTELEAFSYSVAHDLRTPLRSIGSFAQILERSCGDKLDAEEKEYFGKITTASRRMSELIDDLLNLSRLARDEMQREKVDMSLLAQDIAAELRKNDPGRRARFEIAPGLEAPGDKSFLRIALTNLLGNAWKFTAKHADALIEFGAEKKDGGRVYFVRDDGAGFDMAHADRLFKTFQRLHASHEFHGSGVGLAIVQRILRRHGGRIWAEGEIEKGATFRFTVPPDGKEV